MTAVVTNPNTNQTNLSPRIGARAGCATKNGEFGFTLVEAIIALLLMMVVALGSASLFTFSIYNNSGGIDRASSLAIAQQALEVLRTAQFTSTSTSALLNGGTFVQSGIVRDGRRFTLTTIIDDNPATPAVDVIPSTTFKRITVRVYSESIGAGWASGTFGTVTLISQRTMSD